MVKKGFFRNQDLRKIGVEHHLNKTVFYVCNTWDDGIFAVLLFNQKNMIATKKNFIDGEVLVTTKIILDGDCRFVFDDTFFGLGSLIFTILCLRGKLSRIALKLSNALSDNIDSFRYTPITVQLYASMFRDILVVKLTEFSNVEEILV